MSEDTPEQKNDSEIARARKLVDELGEFWDNVQLFCNRFDQDDTQIMHLGKGNIHARVSQVRDWVNRHDEQVRIDSSESDE